MTRIHRALCASVALLVVIAFAPSPAKAQFVPPGARGSEMMTQMAPMLDMMKAKMGKRRFAMMMQTMGPMVARMMESGDFAATTGLGTPDSFSTTPALAASGTGVALGSSDIASALGDVGGSEMIGMIPQIMRIAGAGFGGHGRLHHRRRP